MQMIINKKRGINHYGLCIATQSLSVRVRKRISPIHAAFPSVADLSPKLYIEHVLLLKYSIIIVTYSQCKNNVFLIISTLTTTLADYKALLSLILTMIIRVYFAAFSNYMSKSELENIIS